MARIRTIKPEFWSDEKIAELEPIDRLVFLGLIGASDDFGRLHDNEKVLDAFIFPYSSHSVRESLANLSRIGRIRRGNAASGKKIIEIVNWSKHQRVDKPQAKAALPKIESETQKTLENSVIPEPIANHSGTNRESFLPRPTTNDLLPTTNEHICSSEAEERNKKPKRRKKSYPEAFEKFWLSYPILRRTDKPGTFKKWKGAIASEIEPERLLAKVREYAESEEGRSEFVPVSTKWLNQQRWQDETAAWNKSKKQEPKASRVPTQEDLDNWQPTGMFDE